MSLKGVRFHIVAGNATNATEAEKKIVLSGGKVFKSAKTPVDYVVVSNSTASNLDDAQESFPDSDIIDLAWLTKVTDGGNYKTTAPSRKKGAAKAKKTSPRSKKVQSESEDEESEEEVKPKRGAKKAAAAPAAKKAPARGKKAAARNSSDEETDEEAVKKAVATPAAATKRGRAASKALKKDDPTSSEDDEPVKPAAKKAPAKKAPAKKAAPAKKMADDDDDDDDGSDDDTVQLPAPAAAPVVQKANMQSKKAVPVDPLFADRDNWSVLCEDNPFFCYDFMLNQTNIGQNNNKFYLVQILVNSAGTQYGVIFRWGRVNEPGQSQWYTFTNKAAAIAAANKKVKEKSTHFIETIRSNPNVETKPGKYTYLQRFGALDDGEDDEPEDEEDEEDDTEKITLHPRLRSLLEMISDTTMINQALFQYGYDANKLPLGKLNKNVLERGIKKLEEIGKELAKDSPSSFALNQLSSEFYTLIPHAHGRSALPPIKTQTEVEKKIELVESLMTLESAKKIVTEKKNKNDPLVEKYKSIGAEITYIPPTDPIHQLITEYAQNTIGQTHGNWKGMEFIDIFEVNRPEEQARMEKYMKANPKQAYNKQLLWHGSRLQNFVGILSTGLRLPQQLSGVHITGYMLGSGSYSANVVSKSLNYCSFNSNREGCILLLEVLLGGSECMINPHYTAHTAIRKEKNNSILGLGQISNDEDQAKFLKWSMDGKHQLMTRQEAIDAGHYLVTDDQTVADSRGDVRDIKKFTAAASADSQDLVKIPMGKLVQTDPADGKRKYLMYDEFVVFNIEQIRIKYICRFKNPNNHAWWY